MHQCVLKHLCLLWFHHNRDEYLHLPLELVVDTVHSSSRVPLGSNLLRLAETAVPLVYYCCCHYYYLQYQQQLLKSVAVYQSYQLLMLL
jgi:hypothetical protein